MNKVVSDACLSAKWVLPEKFRARARALLNEWLSNDVQILEPPLWENELDSILREHVWAGTMSQADADAAQAALDAVPVTVKHISGVRKRAREIAKQANQQRVYDSVYAALAEIEDCELWTADYAFYKAVRASLPFVKYLGNYKPSSVVLP
jgi:predicted nucleic acid-binding protein